MKPWNLYNAEMIAIYCGGIDSQTVDCALCALEINRTCNENHGLWSISRFILGRSLIKTILEFSFIGNKNADLNRFSTWVSLFLKHAMLLPFRPGLASIVAPS